jgi:hypothetical protein
MKKKNFGMTRLMAWMMVPVVSVLTGCATAPTRLYSGPELPADQVAKISTGERQFKVGFSRQLTEKGKILSVDGEKMKGLMVTREIYVLPGQHEIVAQADEADVPGVVFQAWAEKQVKKWNTPLIFNAEAGKSYIIRFDSFNTPESRFVYVYWVEETQTGKYVCGWRSDASKK